MLVFDVDLLIWFSLFDLGLLPLFWFAFILVCLLLLLLCYVIIYCGV